MKSVSGELIYLCHFEAPSDSPNFDMVVYCFLKVAWFCNDEIIGICQISLTCGSHWRISSQLGALSKTLMVSIHAIPESMRWL